MFARHASGKGLDSQVRIVNSQQKRQQIDQLINWIKDWKISPKKMDGWQGNGTQERTLNLIRP